MEWCDRACEACSAELGVRQPVSGCPYDEGCQAVIHEFWHVMGDHRRCGFDCEIARGLYPEVKAVGMAQATPAEVAIVSCADGTVRTHGTYPTTQARQARTRVGKSLGIQPEDGPEGRSYYAIKGSVLIVCADGHLT